LTVNLANPTGYGRILRAADGAVTAIVEQKDATTEQLAITEGNSGVMAVTAKQLRRWLPQLSSQNAQGEYYLTDVIALAADEGTQIKTAPFRCNRRIN
jgi:bifunctional UDP-N-acetylglucosamine pyrophosphorylase/glucosamine-1-phosphate N-acetyltransferase